MIGYLAILRLIHACNFSWLTMVVISRALSIWTQKSGFREQVILELEQIAVNPNDHGRGLGTKLIRDSLPLVKKQLASRGATLKHLIVTTRADNDAQRIYQKELGAKIEATITNLYSADEVFMVARNVR
jgi:ribosomal protein S18 acetylase RimI-like enzyme